MNTNDQKTSYSDITNRILTRIETEHITPRARAVFVLQECGVWGLWLATVIVGAVAVAVTAYVAMNAEYALYEATHENFFTFIIEVLPYIWLVLFVVMTLIASKQLRQTKHGYRYTTISILGSSIAFSLLGGCAFQYLGFGYAFDQILGQQIALYMSQEKMDLKMWQMPESGRLVGMLVPPDDVVFPPREALLFQDINGVQWSVGDSEMNPRETALLQSGGRVRLLGTSTAPGVFHVCGIFPWMYGHMMARAEMERERALFSLRMDEHRQMLLLEKGAAGDPDNATATMTGIPSDHICAHLKIMERM